MYEAVVAISHGDTSTAMSKAYHALQLAKNGPRSRHDVACPFCKGTGSIQIDYNSEPSDPSEVKSVDAECSECEGSGQLNVSKIFSDYLGETYPENAVIAILKQKFKEAKEISGAMLANLEKYEHAVKQKSLDDYFRA
jgi:DnaJ-class molecular chaperone